MNTSVVVYPGEDPRPLVTRNTSRIVVRCDECNESIRTRDIRFLDMPRGLEIKLCPSCYKQANEEGY